MSLTVGCAFTGGATLDEGGRRSADALQWYQVLIETVRAGHFFLGQSFAISGSAVTVVVTRR